MQLTIGQQLKIARESRRLALSDVAHFTRIPVVRLQQLEDDNYAAFGSMAYAKSFLKAYSRFLELDASGTLEALPRPVAGGIDDYRYLTEPQGRWIDSKAARLPKHHNLPSVARSSHSPVRALAALFAVLAVAAGLWGAQLIEWGHTDRSAPAELDPKPAPLISRSQNSLTVLEPASAPTTGQTELEPPLTTMKAIVVPSGGLPAPVSPETPVRRPEIVR